MSTSLRCLIIEDSEDDAQLILRELRVGGYDVTAERVDTPEATRFALAREPWDLVISDYRMPRFTGLEALREIGQRSHPESPFEAPGSQYFPYRYEICLLIPRVIPRACFGHCSPLNTKHPTGSKEVERDEVL